MRRLARKDFLGSQFDAGKNEDCSQQGTGDGADGIKSLRKIQAAFRAVRIAELRNKRIRGSLQKGKAAGNDEQCEQKKRVTAGQRSGPEKERSRGKEQQADYESRFVTGALHHQRRGNRQEKISHVERRLHESGLKTRNRKRLHELANQNVIQIIGDAPEKKQRGDQNERNDLPG